MALCQESDKCDTLTQEAMVSGATLFEKEAVRPGDLFQRYAGRIFVGALGEVYFNSHGDAKYPYLFKQIVNGRFLEAEFQFSMDE